MDSDGFDEDFDSSFINQVDNLEAALLKSPVRQKSSSSTVTVNSVQISSRLTFNSLPSTKTFSFASSSKQPPASQLTSTSTSSSSSSKKAPPEVISIDSDDDIFEVTNDEDAMADVLAQVEQIEAAYNKNPQTWKPPPITRQRTLDGGLVTDAPGPSKSHSSSSTFGKQPPKTKVWDRTAFAQTGWRKGKGKGKGKGKASMFGEDEDEGEEEQIEFEQFPAPFVSIGYAHYTFSI
ncbi:hypothetical protein FRC03_005134 [Tulasnella sp. 419]|nr:hypothetical protein FRC03_005134 [Tulasnella sp. 419]